jgi:cellulose 1,4-beta-cellobiosidase
MGNTTFYGKGMTVDTSKKFTVVTQFLTDSSGNLSEIKRFYVQNGVVIPNSNSNIAGVSGNSITQAFCDAQKTAFGDTNVFDQKGGLAQMGKALAQPMVLVMSLWDDHAVNMLWLDSTYPTDAAGKPGAARGTCPTTSGVPADVESQAPNSKVIYSNIRFGPIGSTVSGLPGGGSNPGGGSSSTTTTTRPATSTTSSASSGPTGGGTAAHWGQCGGIGWTGPTVCASPYTCQKLNDWYYQCL